MLAAGAAAGDAAGAAGGGGDVAVIAQSAGIFELKRLYNAVCFSASTRDLSCASL